MSRLAPPRHRRAWCLVLWGVLALAGVAGAQEAPRLHWVVPVPPGGMLASVDSSELVQVMVELLD